MSIDINEIPVSQLLLSTINYMIKKLTILLLSIGLLNLGAADQHPNVIFVLAA